MLNNPTKPSICEVINRYTNLRRQGKEHVGLCPFHEEKTPSFTVNEEKGVFYCHGCGEGGDVIVFIQKMEGLDFKGALTHLGLSQIKPPNRGETLKTHALKRVSEALFTWVMDMADRVASQMCDIGERANMTHRVLRDIEHDPSFGSTEGSKPLRKELERCEREWMILLALHEDVMNPNYTVELWREREAIEGITGNGEICRPEEIATMYPPLTHEYRQRLLIYVKGNQ